MDDQEPLRTEAPTANSRRFLFAAICFFLAAYALYWALSLKTVVGATADVTESQSGVTFKARVDTGASISSVHCKNIVVEAAEDEPEKNSGKRVRFLLEGPDGEQHWLESTILGFAGIRSASGTVSRYWVRMTFSCAGITKDAIVALGDRSEMKYPLLLGRDFLEDDFVVDVSLDDPDFP